MVSFNYYKGKSAKEIADMFSLEIRREISDVYNTPKKVTQRVERKIIKTVYDSPQSSTRGLALQVKNDLRLRVSHETIRNIL